MKKLSIASIQTCNELSHIDLVAYYFTNATYSDSFKKKIKIFYIYI